MQVSFFRPNLTFKVVNKSKGSTPNGKPASLEALTKYIRQVDYIVSSLSPHKYSPKLVNGNDASI